MNKGKLTISEDVLLKIKQGDIQMRPKLYYTLLSVVSAVAVLLAGLTVSYLISVAIFWFRIETASTMAYGARRNLSESLAAFPWWIVVVAAVLLIVAVVLVRKHGRMYRHKPHQIALAIIVIATVVGLIFYGVGIGGLGRTHSGGPAPGTRGPGYLQN